MPTGEGDFTAHVEGSSTMAGQPPAMRAYVAVVGPARATERQSELAHEVGRLLARSGAVLVCGGLSGVMSSACEGAWSSGGLTVGILPGGDRSAANPFLTVALPTGLGEMRNALVVRSADAIIGIGGGWGTLSELALANRSGTPVFLLESWWVEGGGNDQALGVRTVTPAEAVELAVGSLTHPRGP